MVEKVRIILSISYGVVLGQCTNYLQSRLGGAEDMGDGVQQAEPDQATKKHSVLVVQILQEQIVSYAPPSLHALPPGGLQQLGIQTTVQISNRGVRGM